MTTEVLTDETQANAEATQVDDSPTTDELAEASTVLGHEPVTTEPPSTGTEPQVDDDVTAAVEAARVAAAEEAEARGREAERRSFTEQQRIEQSRNQLEGIRRAFAQRAQAIREYSAEQGLTPEATNRIVETFNAQHAQTVTVRDADWWDHTLAYATQKLADAAKPILADYEAGKIDNFHALLDRITDAKAQSATAGRYTEAQLKEREALAFIKGKRAAQAPGARSTQPQSRSSATPPNNTARMNDPEWARNAPIEEVNAAFGIT